MKISLPRIWTLVPLTALVTITCHAGGIRNHQMTGPLPDGSADLGEAQACPASACAPSYAGTNVLTDQLEGGRVGLRAEGSCAVAGISRGSESNPISITRYAADGSFGWERKGPAGGYDLHVAMAPDGAVIVAGTYTGSVSFETAAGTEVHTSQSTSNLETFVWKLTPEGFPAWVRVFPARAAPSSAAPLDLAVGGDGAVYIGGVFAGEVDFGEPGAPDRRSASHGTFLMKLDAGGRTSWTRTLPSVSVGGIAVAPDGGLWSVGGFEGVVDVDPTAGVDSRSSSGASDLVILHLDASGGYVWAGTHGGPGDQWASDIAIGDDGSPYVAGELSGAPPPLGVPLVNSDAHFGGIVLKLTADGGFVWGHVGSGSPTTDLAPAPGGGVLVLGDSMSITWLSPQNTVLWNVRTGDNNSNARGIAGNATSFVVGGFARGGRDFSPPQDFDPGVEEDLLKTIDSVHVTRFRF